MVAEVRTQRRWPPGRPIMIPILSPGRRSHSWSIADEAAARRTSAIMKHWGVENLIVPNSHALADALAIRTPDMVMLDVPADGTDAIDTHPDAGRKKFRRRGAIDERARNGRDPDHPASRQASRAADAAGSRQADRGDGVAGGAASANAVAAQRRAFASVSMKRSRMAGSSSGISRRSILLRKCVVGAESFARLFHPQKGLLPPSAFLDGASASKPARAQRDRADQRAESRPRIRKARPQSRNRAQRDGQRAAQSAGGANRAHLSSAADGWPGLIFDVLEEQIVQDLPFRPPDLESAARARASSSPSTISAAACCRARA